MDKMVKQIISLYLPDKFGKQIMPARAQRGNYLIRAQGVLLLFEG